MKPSLAYLIEDGQLFRCQPLAVAHSAQGGLHVHIDPVFTSCGSGTEQTDGGQQTHPGA